MTAGKTAIFGPYKSGTTGLFYKLRNSLPPGVRTLFEPDEYAAEPGDADRGVLAKVILHADGGVRYDTFLGFEKKLYLVRDPRDWLVSATLFLTQTVPGVFDDDRQLERILKLLRHKEEQPSSVSLLRILRAILDAHPPQPFEATMDWMKAQFRWLPEFELGLTDYRRVRYEDFVDGRLREVESYLGLPLQGADDVAEEHDHVPRSKRYGEWKHWFVEEDVEYFVPIFAPYIDRYGYSPKWTLNEDRVIDPCF